MSNFLEILEFDTDGDKYVDTVRATESFHSNARFDTVLYAPYQPISVSSNYQEGRILIPFNGVGCDVARMLLIFHFQLLDDNTVRKLALIEHFSPLDIHDLTQLWSLKKQEGMGRFQIISVEQIMSNVQLIAKAEGPSLVSSTRYFHLNSFTDRQLLSMIPAKVASERVRGLH